MGLFGRISGKEVDEFARQLARRLAERFPAELEKDRTKHLSEHRLTKLLEEICEEAAHFKTEKKLGIYKKARLGNTFRWELDELGYTEKFIETATEALIVYISRKAADTTPADTETGN